MIDLFTANDFFSPTFIRTCGGMTLLLLWIKMFYWLRLFNKTRYFIKLIVSTLVDIQRFFLIILVIMMAFITIFYVISFNEEDQTKPYINEHTGSKLIDSAITVYFITVGEFFTDNYNVGPNSILLWPLFLVCNFLMAIIFMNMIIAIMGSTYE